MKDEQLKSLTPKVRFPEFTDGWDEKPFSDLYAFKPTNTLSRDKLNYEGGTVRNIHYGDIHTRFRTLFDLEHEHVPFVTNGSVDAFDDDAFCAEGDLVFADASEDLNDVGKSIEVVALHGQRVLSGTHTILATRRDSQFIVGFGGHLFRSERMRQQIKREAQGSKVYGISPGRLAGVQVCFPSNQAEQRKIAACLTSLDELLAAERRKLEALHAHKKGLMQQVFPLEGESHPRLRFPEFRNAGEWETKKIGDVFDTATGGTPDRTVKAYWNGGIPWVTTSLVDFNVIVSTEETISAAGLKNSAAKIFTKGTILMALYGQGKTRGKVAMLGIDAATNQACAAILPSDDVDQAFAFSNLAGRYDEIRALSNAGGQENLSQGLLRDLPFCYPRDPAEQKRIAACLSSLDALIAAGSRKLDALRAHKKGLMQQLFPLTEGGS